MGVEPKYRREGRPTKLAPYLAPCTSLSRSGEIRTEVSRSSANDHGVTRDSAGRATLSETADACSVASQIQRVSITFSRAR